MKISLFLMTFFVATMSFGKAMETTDPSYKCQVASFKRTTEMKNDLSVGEEVIIYPIQTHLFPAYGISSAANYFFMFIFGNKNLNEVSYSENILKVATYKRDVHQITIDEKTGLGLYISKEADLFTLIKNAPKYKVEFINCKRIPQEAVVDEVLYLTMPDRRPKPYTEINLGYDPLHE